MTRIVLSLIFADKVDLGWDPTIDAKYDGGQRIFDFEVSGRHYKTDFTNILYDHKAWGILTSTTRIFKAFDADDKYKKNPVVIKDFWQEESRDTEDVIRGMILDDISDSEERDDFLKMTLTPIASGRVKVGDEEDHTETTILRGKSPLEKCRINLPNGRFVAVNGFMTDDLDFIDEENEDEPVGWESGEWGGWEVSLCPFLPTVELKIEHVPCSSATWHLTKAVQAMAASYPFFLYTPGPGMATNVYPAPAAPTMVPNVHTTMQGAQTATHHVETSGK